jgi:hypothetical protein
LIQTIGVAFLIVLAALTACTGHGRIAPPCWPASTKEREKKPTVVLEAVANQRLWICHCFFGTAGALNNINLLEKSLLFEPTIKGTAWDVEFTIHN